MQKPKKIKLAPAVCITVLFLLVVASTVMLSHLLLTTEQNIPSTTVELEPDNSVTGSGLGSSDSDTASDSSAAQNASSETVSVFEAKPDADVYDDTGSWEYEATAEIFKAEYNNATDKVTVKSADNKKIIAPGTSNQYDFYIKNTGNVAIRYTVKTEAIITVTVNGEQRFIPLEAKFCDYNGRYVLGTENSFEPMEKLDGLKDNGELSVNRYTKYSLFWQWPYETGNDEDDAFDTVLGNLAAKGDKVEVTVKITVNTTDDEDAEGGIPGTGASSNVGIWVAVLIISSILLILVLFSVKEDKSKNESKEVK